MTIPTLSFVDRVIFNARNDGTASFVEDGAVKGYQTMEAAGAGSGALYGYAAQSHDLNSWEVGYGTWTSATKTLTRTVLWNSLGTFVPVSFDQQPQVMITALAESLAAGAGGSSLVVGTSPIASGSGNNLLYDHTGILGEVTIGSGLTFSGGTLAAVGSSGSDPLFLTQGLSVNVTNPTLGGDPNDRRSAQFITTYNELNSNIGFTGQTGLAVSLNFLAGFNQYGAAGGTLAKYTPIALSVDAQFYGAGEKFVQSWSGAFYSMGDAFLWTGNSVYCNGPIDGDEGTGWTPAFTLNQPNNTATETITAVVRTTYTATVTSDITASQTAQVIPVSTTVGANVGDWIIFNQSVSSGSTQIWASQIQSINPGVSITCICAINLNASTGHSITPALCMNLSGAAFQFGEFRVLANYSGASYSTGTVTPSGGAMIGSGTAWTANMVGGDALNVGVMYLDVDTLTASPFSVGSPLRSVYQITAVSPTSLTIFSFSGAGDVSYHGRGTNQPNNTYKIVPGARMLLDNPPANFGPSYNVICETSAHTWTVGDTVECVICPYPDLHGFDWRLGQWTAGGTRRYHTALGNVGARSIQYALTIGSSPGLGPGSLAGYDSFAFEFAGIHIDSCNTGIEIVDPSNGSTVQAFAALTIGGNISGHASDLGSRLIWGNWGSLGINATNRGMDFIMSPDGSPVFSCIGQSVNADGARPQLVWTGYFQIAPFGVQAPLLRMGAGGSGVGVALINAYDISFSSSADTLEFGAYNGAGQFRHTVTFSNDGDITFGNFLASSTDKRMTLDAKSNLTAPRIVEFMDTNGDVLVAAANTTGGGTALLGTNSPAVTNTAPYTWLQMISHDGSTVYVPAWK